MSVVRSCPREQLKLPFEYVPKFDSDFRALSLLPGIFCEPPRWDEPTLQGPHALLVLQEFRQSAIPDRLTYANVRWVEDNEAVLILAEEAIAQAQSSTSFVGAAAARILKCYQFAEAGGWVSFGSTLDGQMGQVAYFKPQTPRIDFEKRKRIKYETPAKCEALPLLPYVDPQTAEAIYGRYHLTPREGETFWQVIQRSQVPIAITEGLKKALALIAHGIPAIALRGITQWHPKGTNALHPILRDLATLGRRIYVVFDQDTKESTQKAVRQQVLKLTEALEQRGCLTQIPQWDRTTGKGIDDALYRLGDEAQTWLDGILQAAPDRATYKRDSRILKALEHIQRLNTLTYPVERATEGEYLPQLPELQPGVIHVLTADMNAGKTTRIGTDWVGAARAQDWLTIVLSPTNATGQQTAHSWGLPHIHDYHTDAASQQALWAEVRHRGGIVLCAESLHRLPEWLWSMPILLVLDEANQVIEGLTQGDTLGSRYSLILETLSTLAHHALETGAIVLSEDGVPDRTVNFIKTVAQGEAVRVFTHRKAAIPWDCTVYRGQASGFRGTFLQAAQSGARLLYVTSSQREAKRLERALAKLCPECKVVRIDSETNQQGQFTEFFEQPDRWLETHQPNILILSPSAKSGVSIQGGVRAEDAYFSQVWGYFPALGTDTHAQLLGRYRPPVPRVVFCPDFILGSGDESLLSPRAIKRRLGLNARGLAGVYGLGDLLNAQDDDEAAEQMATLQTAVLDYVVAARAALGNQKVIAHLALVARLNAAGHSVKTTTTTKDADLVTLWKDINEAIWREEAQAIAQAPVEEWHTLEWARKTLDRLDATLDTRLLAQKVIWRSDFPGMLFDEVEECYQALCRDYGAMARGVTLQAKAENLEGAKIDEAQAVKDLLSGNIKALHRLPRTYVQALIVAQSGVLELLDGVSYSNADPRCQRVKEWALRFAHEISYWLRLQIKESQTPIEICHKLLKKLGLERDKPHRPGAIQMIGRKGKRRANSEHFQVHLEYSPVRAKLLEAARRKLSESVPSILKSKDASIPIDEAEAKGPPHRHLQGVSPPPSPEVEGQIPPIAPCSHRPDEIGRTG